MKKRYLLLALVCLLLTGCSMGEGAQAGTETEADKVEEHRESASLELPAEGNSQGNKTYYVGKVDTLQFQEPEKGYTEHAASYKVIGDHIYMIRVESKAGGSVSRVCVQSYDVVAKDMRQYLIEPEISGHENSGIYSADLTAGLELSLKMWDAGDEDAFYLVRMNLEGEVLRVEDAFPEGAYPWNQDMWSNVKAFDLSDGRTVICRNDFETFTSSLAWYQEDAGEDPLGTLNNESVQAMTVDQEGTLYYLGGEGLVRYDAEHNAREVLFRAYENGIEIGLSECGIAMNDKGQFLLCVMKEGKASIYLLADEETSDEDKIRLCSLQGRAGIYYFQTLAASFQQNGGNVRIGLELEEKEEYQEDYRTRILAELTAGKGPDILYVSQQDMMLLQDKGLICDISEMIPSEVKSELIPGALELGTVNGELVGLVPEVSFTTMSVANQVWDQDSWTIDDFVEQLGAKEDWELPVNWSGFSLSPGTMFRILFSDLADSFVLNLEQGTCDFDNDRLIHILEFCKKYGITGENSSDQQLSQDERMRMFRDGEMAAEVQYLYGDLDMFSTIMARNGEDCHIVGYPTEKGSGNYVDSYSYGYLVINAQSKYKEEIKKYFALLLDYDNQFKTSGCSVRMDVLRNCVVYHEFEKTYYKIYSYNEDQPTYQSIDLKPDGTPYLEEFLEFVAGCRPMPYCPSEIEQIVYGEINLFFDGSKSAEETVKVIQSRIKLYLDEMK
ncbi:MAG: extracellular solute-binding protein [bacterium]|nr:extracellular solute-binding protein [bacterium]MCM1374935.1 extracellular solute-binding protein [Muribaculum sp.]